MATAAAPVAFWSAFEPLRERTFRRIWSASILANFGQLIHGVGAAWEMTRLASSASMVALVQTALMLPLMLIAVPAGAMADMFDRRRIALIGLCFASLDTRNAFHAAGPGPRVRRRLERPFGSVRWRAETPDPRPDPINICTP